jgi:hypothetical protein
VYGVHRKEHWQLKMLQEVLARSTSCRVCLVCENFGKSTPGLS